MAFTLQHVLLHTLSQTIVEPPGLFKLPCCIGRWYKVVRMVVMRQRCTRQALRDAPVQPARVHTNTVPFQSFFGSRVSGPQFSLVFIMHPPAKYPGHPDFQAPPPAELDIEVCSAPHQML